jgi:hypothetical protein
LEARLANLGIKKEDLIPIQDFPHPRTAFKTLLESETASDSGIDLGTSYPSCVSTDDLPGLYLGRQK